MKLIKKTIEKYNRTMYQYFPEGETRSPFKRSSVTIIREDDTETSVKELLGQGLSDFADKYNIVLSFPNPIGEGWNYSLSEGMDNDIEVLKSMQDALGTENEVEAAQPYIGIPTFEMMMNNWHIMNDAKYMIGIGNGASMAYSLAACAPDNIVAIWGIGGELSLEAKNMALNEAIPAYLEGAGGEAVTYFKSINAVDHIPDTDGYYRNLVNPLQCVKINDNTGNIIYIEEIWNELFSKVRRTNTGTHGECEPRLNLSEVGFEIFLEDEKLGDGLRHSWFTHVPQCIKRDYLTKVPLMIFMHGGSDNPEEAAEMSKFHEIGEREGFITVYPWASNKAVWNMQLLDIQGENKDDVLYILSLIEYMRANYPVDEQRIYLSGFSNGAGMAQTVAMLHPEKIAAICHIDSNWPGERLGPAEFDPEVEKPFRLALTKQNEFPYRMPVWYTYGTREPSYPVYNKCSQQHQYDFWKRYNNIKIRMTPDQEVADPSGCGVPGDVTESLKPCSLHPNHQYDIQRFYSEDDGNENLYNFVIMRDKGHEVARMDPELGWNYVKQFRRNPNGSLERSEKAK
jgi:poly(3-hydroxybutyrate) depolymerase